MKRNARLSSLEISKEGKYKSLVKGDFILSRSRRLWVGEFQEAIFKEKIFRIFFTQKNVFSLATKYKTDADAGSSSNMVSSQPGVPLGLQSWSARSKNTFVAAHRMSRWKKPRTSE